MLFFVIADRALDIIGLLTLCYWAVKLGKNWSGIKTWCRGWFKKSTP